METTNISTLTAIASESAVGALRALSLLSRQDGEMSSIVAALHALTGTTGPLAELVTLTDNAAGWLVDFEHEDADAAADRIQDAGHSITVALEQLTNVLPLLRPLAD